MTKPKIGILSMQRVINYGSFLQAYALRELLHKNGAGSVSFIDIIPGRRLIENTINIPILERRLRKLSGLIKNGRVADGLKTFIFNRRLTKSIHRAWPVLELDDSAASKGFDCVVIGSDEVFNCCQETAWGYTTQLYGDIPATVAPRVISYAGSFGNSRLADLRHFGVADEIGTVMSRMTAISVRDENSRQIVETLTGRTPLLHIDPVLAYGFHNEIETMTQRPLKEKYMVVYTYQGRMDSPREIEAVRAYAHRHSLKTISIFCRYGWCDNAALPDTPLDVLRWFRHAECIVTDTFHGTIFSIITHSRFATFIRPSNRNKLHHLLDVTGLTTHECADPQGLASILDTPVDPKATKQALEPRRAETNAYLSAAIEKCYSSAG